MPPQQGPYGGFPQQQARRSLRSIIRFRLLTRSRFAGFRVPGWFWFLKSQKNTLRGHPSLRSAALLLALFVNCHLQRMLPSEGIAFVLP
jgi:hypothetical protein